MKEEGGRWVLTRKRSIITDFFSAANKKHVEKIDWDFWGGTRKG